MTFNHFTEKFCDRLYTPELGYEEQSTGYKQLRKMVKEQINPATKEETERWENYPTEEELVAIPDIKYMRSLHPNLRTFIRDSWETVKKLKL